jgi:hypothetical protein
MVGSMKSNRKKPLGQKGGASPKASGNLATKPDIARQYEDLCRLREKARAQAEKVRSLRPKDQD